MTPDELFNLAAKSRDLSENAPNPSDRWHFTKLAFAYERMAQKSASEAAAPFMLLHQPFIRH